MRIQKTLKFLLVFIVYALAAGCSGNSSHGEARVEEPRRDKGIPECDAHNAGLQLPEGFCAFLVADNIGPARHMAVNDNGDIYVAIRGGHGGIAALRDRDNDGRADIVRRFGDAGGTGMGIWKGYLYFASNTFIDRYRLSEGSLVPPRPPERVVTGFPEQGQHAAKSFDFGDRGWMYVNIGAPSNACQEDTRTPGSPGMDPCPQLERHGGVWRFKADKTGQNFNEGTRYATGIRNSVAIAWNRAAGKLYVVQHGRDQLGQLWPDLYTDKESAELPAEEFFKVEGGSDFGWPYCYYDHIRNKKVLSPEYGGDSEKIGRCGQFVDPILAFPGHFAPNDLIFYFGKQFPKRYWKGAFIAFHGSWNRAPFEQRGYKVAFVPFAGETPSEGYEVFADGFAGVKSVRTSTDARFRPMGLAEGPDGSLYVVDSRRGRLWRIIYSGKNS
ncbi:MAG: PQQ-dependent sugar dehydrogenase [Thermodesulfobacteriota bacterium]